MMTNKINSLKELWEEKRILKYEIDATERLLSRSLKHSKRHIFNGVISSLIPLGLGLLGSKSRSVNIIDSMVKKASGDTKKGWISVILTFLPIAIRLWQLKQVNNK